MLRTQKGLKCGFRLATDPQEPHKASNLRLILCYHNCLIEPIQGLIIDARARARRDQEYR